MLKNIFKIYMILCWISKAFGGHFPQVTTSILDGYADDLNIKPYVRIGHKLYHFGQTKVNWFKASLNCRSLDGFLASFDTEKELTELSNYMIDKLPLDGWWWLSGSNLHDKGDFYWYSTGEMFSYTDWSQSEPNNASKDENCVFLWYKKSKYQMNDWICNGLAYYICEADKPKTIVLSVF